jgi:hypothetical protein
MEVMYVLCFFSAEGVLKGDDTYFFSVASAKGFGWSI